MDTFIILAQSRKRAEELQARLAQNRLGPGGIVAPVGTADRDENNADESLLVEFESLTAKIEENLGGSPRGEVTAIVDRIIPREMDAAAGTARWSHLIAMLILVFPEVMWTFDEIEEVQDSRFPVGFPVVAHGFRSFFPHVRRSPLLDPTGLRDWIRRVTNLETKNQGFQLPVRPSVAAVIEDEKSYAYFHAYTAYRFGFRVDMVTSWTLMKKLFNPPGYSTEHGYDLLLEDVSLKFPDKSEEIHLANFKARALECRLLKDDDSSKFRVIVTTGQVEAHGSNEESVGDLPVKQNRKCPRVLKPTGGMFDLWQQAGLRKNLGGVGREGIASGYDPLPEKGEDSHDGGHGSPGKLMLIAEHLLRRSEKIRSTASTIEHYVVGAVLAGDALELLGGRTPTISLAALTLKQEYEVRAESTFIGVGFHLDVVSRQQEIERDVARITQWYDAGSGQKARRDALVVILNRVASVFRQAGQFEEEQEVLASVRHEHRQLMLLRASHPGNWITNRVLQYAEWLLASFGQFLMAILGWNAFFVLVRWKWGGETLDLAIFNTMSSFFGGNTTDHNLSLFSCFVVVTGIFHIGVFISYLYSIIVRR